MSPFVVAAAVIAVVVAAVLWPGPQQADDPDAGRTPSTASSAPGARASDEPLESEEPQDAATGKTLTSGLAPSAAQHCDLPRFGVAAAAQQRFVRSALTCLEHMWRPALDRAGVEFRPVRLIVVTHKMTDCFGDPVLPTDITFYCDDDTTIYWTARDRDTEGATAADWPWFLFVAMHEYGHHLQLLSGTADEADSRWQLTDEGSPEEDLVSRRVELQAQCLAGVSLAAAQKGGLISRSDARTLVNLQGTDSGDKEDEATHGHGASNKRWTNAGYRGGSTKPCDTWSARAGEVY